MGIGPRFNRLERLGWNLGPLGTRKVYLMSLLSPFTKIMSLLHKRSQKYLKKNSETFTFCTCTTIKFCDIFLQSFQKTLLLADWALTLFPPQVLSSNISSAYVLRWPILQTIWTQIILFASMRKSCLKFCLI